MGLLFVFLSRWISYRCNTPFFMTFSFVSFPVAAALYLNWDLLGIGMASCFMLGMLVAAIANLKMVPVCVRDEMMAMPVSSSIGLPPPGFYNTQPSSPPGYST